MAWLERIGRVIRANISSLIQEAEDPEKVLEDMVLNLERELIEMRKGLAAAIATQKLTERDIHKYQQAVKTWYERAELALLKGNEDLAREALGKKYNYQSECNALQTQLEQQSQIVQKLKKELQQLERQYLEIKAKKSLYLARLKSATASRRMREILQDPQFNSFKTVFERIESQILEIESYSELTSPSSSDPLENQFAILEREKNINAELDQMKEQK